VNRRRSPTRLAPPALASALAGALALGCAGGAPFGRAHEPLAEQTAARSSREVAEARERAEDLEGALRAVQEALQAAPGDGAARLLHARILAGVALRDRDAARAAEARRVLDAALAEPTESYDVLLAQALVELAERRPAEAEATAKRAARERPDSADAHVILARARLAQFELRGARTAARIARRLDPSRPAPTYLLVAIHERLDEPERALELGRSALEKEEDPHLRVLLAQVLARQRRFDEVVAMLEAIPEEARTSEVWLALGRLRRLQGDRTAARALFERARGVEPTRYEPLRELLALDAQEGRLPEAEQRIAAAVASRPDDARLVRLQGEAALYRGDHASAEASLRRALQLDPGDPGPYEVLLRLYAAQERPEDVLKTLEASLPHQAGHAHFHLMLGSLYEQQGRVTDAVARYEEALRLDPELAVAKNNLAYLLAESRTDLPRALALAQEARAALPDDPHVADTLGWVLYRRKSPYLAIPHLKEAVRLLPPDDPQGPAVRYHLALAYTATGSIEAARRTVDEALRALDAQTTPAGAASPGAAQTAEALAELRDELAARP